MKILLLGAFGNGALENYYVQGLLAKNADIETFDITRDYYGALERSIVNKVINKIKPAVYFKPINRDLLQYISGKKYDAIIVFKGYTIFPDTLKQLKQFTKLLCCYNPDHPFRFFSEGSGNDNVKDSIDLYDFYLTYAENITRDIKQLYKTDCYTIPFGYDDTNSDNISFPPFSANEAAGKWVFIGSYDSERAAFLNDLNEQHIIIYGDAKWKTRNQLSKIIQSSYAGRSLYAEDYKAAIHNSMGVFNWLRKQNIEEGSHNMRTFEVPGYGGVLIANRTEEQLNFFEENKEAIYFDCIEELKDKLVYLKTHNEEVEKIKVAAWKRCRRSNYSYLHRSALLYNILTRYLR
ncbi:MULTISPECIES: CgeB family protein [Niastella]|uniref:Glycosyltransferase n=1 Tax=Niastella soli TaxID=2821487 RepID=A0ABS3YRT2_9BACT|nr:glycosyltransferase [Niastella soli]MBO9200155.1 glycosyltransferase [Niastella soli]